MVATVKTKAIVLSAIKYSDSSLIVKCYTEQSGIKSYLLRGILKSKKGNLKSGSFQPLTLLNLQASHKQKSSLNTIKEASVFYHYNSIYKDIAKQSIVVFISEVLTYSLQEEEENKSLFSYLENGLIWLDTHEKVSNFHLLFLLNLTKFLGFYPDVSQKNKTYFHLQNGYFTDTLDKNLTISGTQLVAFKKLLGINFDAIETVAFSKEERQTILQMIIRYFELHLSGFKTPKSLSVLEAVFS